MRLLALIALALPIGVQAQGSKTDRWKSVSVSASGDSTFIDMQSIVQDLAYGVVRVWVQMRFQTPVSDGVPRGKAYIRSVARHAYNCKARTMMMTSWTGYAKDGAVVATNEMQSSDLDIPPTSLLENILEAVCAPSNERPQTSGSQANYPPQPLDFFLPPLPPPVAVRGFHFTAEFEVDETGKVLNVTFTRTSDSDYNRRIDAVLNGMRFRPGTRPDGTPVRMKARVGYEF